MSNTLSAQFFTHLLGPDGAYFMEFGSLEALLQKAVLRSFFASQDKQHAAWGQPPLELRSHTARRYVKGQLPDKVSAYYSGTIGCTYAIADMQLLTALPGRITRLRSIQDRIHRWLCSAGLPEEDVQKLNVCYCPNQASRETIGIYLAHVMVYVMAAA